MSDTRQAALMAKLFGDEGTRLVNFKLLRGDDPAVTKEELCDEIHLGITQVQIGAADTHTEFPEEGTPETVDLTKIT